MNIRILKKKIQQVAALSHKYKAPVYTHLSETEYEVNTCKEKTGRSPVEYLCDLGVYDYGGGAFHCVHMSEHDLELFEEKTLKCYHESCIQFKACQWYSPNPIDASTKD